MGKDLDAQVEAFCTQPLDAGPYTFLAADALTMEVPEAGEVVDVACLIVAGVIVCSVESHRGGSRYRRRVIVCSVESHPGGSRCSAA
jgi:hypothetical protein